MISSVSELDPFKAFYLKTLKTKIDKDNNKWFFPLNPELADLVKRSTHLTID
jgi:hypothetical protein